MHQRENLNKKERGCKSSRDISEIKELPHPPFVARKFRKTRFYYFWKHVGFLVDLHLMFSGDKKKISKIVGWTMRLQWIFGNNSAIVCSIVSLQQWHLSSFLKTKCPLTCNGTNKTNVLYMSTHNGSIRLLFIKIAEPSFEKILILYGFRS